MQRASSALPGNRLPRAEEHVCALAKADLTGEQDHLVRLVRRRDRGVQRHGIRQQLDACRGSHRAYGLEHIQIKASDEISVSQYTRYQARAPVGEG